MLPLPPAPVLLSPTRLIESLTREVISLFATMTLPLSYNANPFPLRVNPNTEFTAQKTNIDEPFT